MRLGAEETAGSKNRAAWKGGGSLKGWPHAAAHERSSYDVQTGDAQITGLSFARGPRRV
ncbi:MAG: hypothetical protein ACRD34_11620 [Bryobacteraceae bacterium]